MHIAISVQAKIDAPDFPLASIIASRARELWRAKKSRERCGHDFSLLQIGEVGGIGNANELRAFDCVRHRASLRLGYDPVIETVENHRRNVDLRKQWRGIGSVRHRALGSHHAARRRLSNERPDQIDDGRPAC